MNTDAPDTIVAADVRKRFPGVFAVDGVSFSVRKGEIFGLVGPDGAGKTTLVRMLAAVMPPDSGAIAIDGVDAVADPEQAKQHLSYMPQKFGLYEDLTVDENIRFYSDIFEIPKALREERIGPLLAASNMTEFRKRLAGQLSGGMKQKLGLMCALIHTPRVLLLDEPTTGVDPVSRRDFWKILYSLQVQGVTILISTAYLDEAERCNRLALIHHGHLRYCDTPRNLKKKMPGTMVNIASARARDVHKILLTLPGVSASLLMGDHVHVALEDDGIRGVPAIERALDAAGIPHDPVEPAEPSIEDLFVGLLKDEEKAS
jgi:ABC-2 type transport system ATP-binding protein